MFGPAETLHSTYRLLRDEVLEGTMRAGGRLAELRLDTDLDVSHAVVRYLELLKLAALIERPEGQSLAEAVRDVNSRILQAVTAEQREIFTSSALDDYLLDAERDARRRAAAVVGPRRPVGRVVPAHARRRGRAVGLGHRHVPDVPLEVQVRAGVPDPAGADDPSALRDRRPPGARALPRGLRPGRRRFPGRWPSCWGCSTRAGAAAASASPRRSASCAGKARRGADALPRPVPVRGG